jgi:hypothetical protein
MKKPHHNVYVIQLDKAVMQVKKFMEDNPHIPPDDTHHTPVYVGMTGLPVEERFQNHLRGYKSRGFAHKHGIKLLPKLYEHLNPMTFEDAKMTEKLLADALKKQGYPVWQR